MEHPVLFLQVVDDFLLLLVQIASEGNQHQSKWIQISRTGLRIALNPVVSKYLIPLKHLGSNTIVAFEKRYHGLSGFKVSAAFERQST